jgi:hypothetical protein
MQQKVNSNGLCPSLTNSHSTINKGESNKLPFSFMLDIVIIFCDIISLAVLLVFTIINNFLFANYFIFFLLAFYGLYKIILK